MTHLEAGTTVPGTYMIKQVAHHKIIDKPSACLEVVVFRE